jgi:very-short-patch-repair endonuclease
VLNDDPTQEPNYETEYYFDPERDWRFDFAWSFCKVAVELDGGRWAAGGGKHATAADYWKIAHATAAGWLVLRFSSECINGDPQQCVDLVLQALELRGYPCAVSSS